MVLIIYPPRWGFTFDLLFLQYFAPNGAFKVLSGRNIGKIVYYLIFKAPSGRHVNFLSDISDK
jgi:hypothetical protein